MPLSEKQLEELYKKTIENHRDIHWIREDLEKGGKLFTKHEKRIGKVEKEQSLLKGKIGAFILFLTLCGTIMIQGIGWVISHLLSSKGGP